MILSQPRSIGSVRSGFDNLVIGTQYQGADRSPSDLLRCVARSMLRCRRRLQSI